MFYPNDNAFPYTSLAYIIVTWSDGATTQGSGAIVGPNDVLTAAHVVYSPNKRPTDIDVYASYNGSIATSYPTFTAGTWHTNSYTIDQDGDGLLNQDESAWDIAVIGLSDRIGDSTGWFGIRSYAPSGFYSTAGYPGTHSGTLVGDYGYMNQSNVFDLTNVYSQPGSSGSPIFDSSNFIVGVISTGYSAARIDDEWDQISAWMSGNDYLITTSNPKPSTPEPLYLVGGDGVDILTGGALGDTLYGGGGHDVLSGRGGNDRLFGRSRVIMPTSRCHWNVRVI